jgi:hypothetical protein
MKSLGRLWILRGVGMLGTLVNLQLAVDRASKTIVRDHSLDRALDEEFGTALAALAEGLGLVASDESGEAHVALLGLFFAADLDFSRVDHDDEIAGINMGCEDRLVLAAKQVGGLDGDMAEVLVFGIDHPPLAFDLGSFSGKSLHSDFGKGGKE